MNSHDESPASAGSRDVAGAGWLREFKALRFGFGEAVRGLEDLSLYSPVIIGSKSTRILYEDHQGGCRPQATAPSSYFWLVIGEITIARTKISDKNPLRIPGAQDLFLKDYVVFLCSVPLRHLGIGYRYNAPQTNPWGKVLLISRHRTTLIADLAATYGRWTCESLSRLRFYFLYRLVIGKRRSFPKAREVIFTPGALCLLLYSFVLTILIIFRTVPLFSPSFTMSSTPRPSST